MPALAVLSGLAGADAPASVEYTKIEDFGVDTNGNELYDELVVRMHLNASQGGTYTFICYLRVQVSGSTLLIDRVLMNVTLDEGANQVDVVFPSEPINALGISGIYRVDIECHYWAGGKFPITHSTKPYDYRTFEGEDNQPPVTPEAPDVELGSNYINVTTEVFQVFVNRTSPEVIYRYVERRPGLPDFAVTYSRLIFFQDGGDRIYDGETPVASVLLTNYPWVLSNILVSGPKVSFDLKGRVSIPVCSELVGANVWLTFTLTNSSVLDPESSSWIRGDASELKVDVRLEMEGAVAGADHVSLESSVTDSLGNQDFMVEEPVGYQLYPHTVETTYLPVPRLPSARYTVVGQVNENQVWLAYQGWMNTAEEEWGSEGSSLEVEVRGSFRVKGGQMELLITYPYSDDLTVLVHDPSLGVMQENLPQAPAPVGPPEAPEPNIYVFFLSLIVGAVILVLTVYARAQGY